MTKRILGIAEDHAECQMGFTEDGYLILDFLSPTTWIKMTRADALRMAEALLRHAEKMEDKP